MPRPTASLLLAALLVVLVQPPAARAEVSETTLGYSQGGVPLVVYHIGEGASRVLVLGGQHGGPEANTIELANGLLNYFAAYPEEVPSSVRLDILVVANPDGVSRGSRQFLSGVDPNRNWGSADWERDAWDSNGSFRLGLGGSAPFSEPETRALRDWILATRPALVINYHSRGGFMFGTQSDLVETYADASAYHRPRPGVGGRLLGYRPSGTMNVWMREQGLVGILVELTNYHDPELQRNLAGVRAVLRQLHGSQESALRIPDPGLVAQAYSPGAPLITRRPLWDVVLTGVN